jgi:23S rRNA (pseudouridine1915-N3)-methyltransferase
VSRSYEKARLINLAFFVTVLYMKIQIITTGSPNLAFAKQGITEYTKRLSRFVDLSVIHVKENKDTDTKIIKTIGNDVCILFDEEGKEYTSRQFAKLIDKKKIQGLNISFIIGGPDGHTDVIRERADMSVSLSQLTFPHDIAMMLSLESIYRAYTINAGHPYHRD